MVWFLFQNFAWFFVIHKVKGFSIVNEADVLLELPCFLYDPLGVGSLISGSSAFLNPVCISGSSWLTYFEA